jgi:hypothetical protein
MHIGFALATGQIRDGDVSFQPMELVQKGTYGSSMPSKIEIWRIFQRKMQKESTARPSGNAAAGGYKKPKSQRNHN